MKGKLHDRQIERGVMIQGRMLDNGKPQTGSAACLGPTLVHAIEPLKYLALFFRRDTDSRIYREAGRLAALVNDILTLSNLDR